MPSHPQPRQSALTCLPHELQTQIYTYALPSQWSLNIHPKTIGLKHQPSHKATSSWPSATCSDETHPQNPSAALLLTCRITRHLAQPILRAAYDGSIAICPETILASEILAPDVHLGNLISLLRRDPWLQSTTHTLHLPMVHIRTRFADHLWDALHSTSASPPFLPNLRTIVLTDSSYCYVSTYRGKTGITHSSSFGDPLYAERRSVEDFDLCCEVAQRRFRATLFDGVESDDVGVHPNSSAAGGQGKLRWVPEHDALSWARSDSHAGGSGSESGDILQVYYQVRFRVEDKADQAYEARFMVRQESEEERRRVRRLGDGNRLVIYFEEFGVVVRLVEVRRLTGEEDEAWDWDGAAETDLTSMWSDDEAWDDTVREYEEDEYL